MTVADFLKYLEIEKRYSEKTIKAYGYDLSQFEEFIQTGAGHFAFIDVTSFEVRQWMMYLMENGYSAISINRKLSSLRSYVKFLRKNGVMQKDPLAAISAPKNPKRLPVFVRVDEMERLLNDIPFENNFVGVRDRLVLEMLYGTGLRVSELATLRYVQIDEHNRVVRIIGKRNKERIVPINENILSGLQRLKKYVNEEFDNVGEFVFLTKKGEPAYETLIYRIVKRNLTLVTTQHKKSPHVLRHTFATVLLNNGAELNVIKELLGHSNLSATEVYTHSTFKDLTRAYKLAHPRA